MVLSVLVICVGTAIAAVGEVDMTALGLFLMFAAEFMEAIRLVMTQYLLQNLKFGIVEGQFYLAPAGMRSVQWCPGCSDTLEFGGNMVVGRGGGGGGVLERGDRHGAEPPRQKGVH